MFNNKSILITGGTGSFGKAFLKNTLKKYKNIKRLVIFSRDEFKQFELSEEFPEKKFPFLRYYLGDVRDKDRLHRALNGIDYVIHAAALKQVPKAEEDPDEFIKTNIIGAQNLIQSSIERKVKKVVALSTDKAASPINLYGATKLCSDKLFIAANNIRGKRKIDFSIVRYGNVAGSRGSVIPFFRDIAHKNLFPITHKDMTRFWITLDQSISMVEWSFKNNRGGEIVVPKIKSFKVLDLAKAINPKAKIKIIGIRPGEKIHEDLITNSDSLNTYEYRDYYIIYPPGCSKKLINMNYKKVKTDFSYNSGKNLFMTIPELKKSFLKIDSM
jgi:UDP-N-acetylglucosamine 4,6-dehydratase